MFGTLAPCQAMWTAILSWIWGFATSWICLVWSEGVKCTSTLLILNLSEFSLVWPQASIVTNVKFVFILVISYIHSYRAQYLHEVVRTWSSSTKVPFICQSKFNQQCYFPFFSSASLPALCQPTLKQEYLKRKIPRQLAQDTGWDNHAQWG